MKALTDAFWQGRNRFPKKMVGNYFDDLKKPKAACHLGAIYWGEFKTTSTTITSLLNLYPELHKMVDMPCTDTDENEGWISAILIHLSDAHDKRAWPDQAIADWLETVLP